MKKIAQLILLAGLLSQTQPIYAAGFLIAEQSVSGMGVANASNSAGAFDATTAYTNPAGMMFLDSSNEVVAGLIGIFPSTKYHDRGTINSLGQLFPKSSNGGNGGETAWVPNLSYVKKLGSRFAFGLSASAPFGLSTKWGSDWYGRYYATLSEIKTTNINPSIAVKVTDKLSIGGGFNALYFHAELKNKIDFGLILYDINPALGVPEEQDGKVRLKGNTWGFGGNVGLMYQLGCNTRFGVQWRSQVKIDLNHAHANYQDVPPILQGTFFNTKAKAKIKLPDVVSFGLWHKFCNAFAIMADFQWTHWQLLKELRVKFPNGAPALTESNIPLKWKDRWRFAVGGTYDWNCKTTFRAGYAYDQSPTPNDVFRSPRLPDQDRQWMTLGLQYRYNCNIAFDLSYAHIWVRDAVIDRREAVFANTDFTRSGGLFGTFKSHIDLVGASVRYQF